LTKLQIIHNNKLRRLLPGVLLATSIAVTAEWIHEMIVVGGEKPVSGVIIAIIIGALISNSFNIKAQIAPGVNYIMSKVLKAAIILLGLSLSFMVVIRTGALALVVIVITVTLAIVLTYWIGHKLGLPGKLAALIAIGTAICGATAIVSTAPVIEAEDEDITYAVATITIFGILAIFVYPILGKLMLLNDLQFGTWAGVAVHETAQVVAAGFAFSSEAGEIATVVKLTRTVLLAPLVLIVGVIYARKNQGQCGEINYLKIFPWFVVGFLLMAGLRTIKAAYCCSNGRGGLKNQPANYETDRGNQALCRRLDRLDHHGCFEPADYFCAAHLVKVPAQTPQLFCSLLLIFPIRAR